VQGQKAFRGLAVLLAALVGIGLSAVPAAAAPRVVLDGTVPAWASADRLVGRVPAGRRVEISVYLGWRNPRGAEQLAAAVSDPAGKHHRRYLTAQQFTAAYAPTTETAGTVTRYLAAYGLRLVELPTNRRYLRLTGTTAQVEAAFATRLRLYRAEGRTLRAPAVEPSVPSALASRVIAVAGLDTGEELVRPATIVSDAVGDGTRCSPAFGSRRSPLPLVDGARPAYVGCGALPAQLQTAYLGRRAAADYGREATVAVLTATGSPTLQADERAFARAHGVPAVRPGQLTARGPAGTIGGPDAARWAAAQTTGVHLVRSLAPAAGVLAVSAGGASLRLLDAALNRIVTDQAASVVALPYALPERAVGARLLKVYSRLFLQAAAQGIGVTAAAGDAIAGQDNDPGDLPSVHFPASDPWVVAAGGSSHGLSADGATVFATGWASRERLLRRSGWETAPGRFIYGATGGRSVVFDRPGYQAAAVAGPPEPRRGPAGGGRAVPDVALLADPNTGVRSGLTVPVSGRPSYAEVRVGGTGVATALWAAVQAVADGRLGTRSGFVGPRLYRQAGTAVFGDITGLPTSHLVARQREGAPTALRSFGAAPGRTAAPGFDELTGLGIPSLATLLAPLPVRGQAAAPAAPDGGDALGPDKLTPATRYLKQLITQQFGVTSIGGWRPVDPHRDSDHPRGKAIDVMLLPIGPESRALGDRLVAWLQANAGPLRIKYVIWQQRVWMPARAGAGWRLMEDRGSPTQNHLDHVHISLH
jgi:hypothetical protein